MHELAVADTCQPHHRLIMRLLRGSVLSTVVCNILDTRLDLGTTRSDSLVGVIECALFLPACMTYKKPSTTAKIAGATRIAWIIWNHSACRITLKDRHTHG